MLYWTLMHRFPYANMGRQFSIVYPIHQFDWISSRMARFRFPSQFVCHLVDRLLIIDNKQNCCAQNNPFHGLKRGEICTVIISVFFYELLICDVNKLLNTDSLTSLHYQCWRVVDCFFFFRFVLFHLCICALGFHYERNKKSVYSFRSKR